MRIPPSTIVMSVVTASLFGYAIYQTVTKQTPYDLAQQKRAEEARVLRMFEEAEAEAKAAHEREVAEDRRTRIAALDSLYDTEPASLGTLFAGIALGDPATSPALVAARQRDDETFAIGFEVEESLRRVRVWVDGGWETVCPTLESRLTAAWGPALDHTWVDRARHVRAHLDMERCHLVFERFVDAAAWVDAIPFDAHGTPATDTVDREAPGVGAGHGDTGIVLLSDGKRVDAVVAHATTDAATAAAIRDAISKRLRSQPTTGEPGVWEWKRTVPVRLDHESDGDLKLTIGEPS